MSGVPTSIRVSPLDSPTLPRTVRGLLIRRRSELIEGMIYAQDWPDHKHRIGVIEGLNEAIEMCDMIEEGMNRERRGES